MNRERTNLWVAKTVPMMIEIAKTVGAPPFPGRDAEIEQIERWLEMVATLVNGRITQAPVEIDGPFCVRCGHPLEPGSVPTMWGGETETWTCINENCPQYAMAGH